MPDGVGEQGPRLPPRPDLSRFAGSISNVGDEQIASRSTATEVADWITFDPPRLVSLGVAQFAVVATRLIVLSWGASVLWRTFELRDDPDDAAGIGRLGALGLVAISLMSVAGWWWSDRATQNVHRLEGRFPPRWRCATAWLIPPLVAIALATTLLRLEPTEGVDVRPAVVILMMAVVSWRPYALVRRIFASVIRVRHDASLAAAYVLDVSALGLLWWQIETWPTNTDDRGRVDVLIGVTSAAVVGLAAGIGLWIAIGRLVDRAMADRMFALRTRHDHRQLRLRGIDPMDPEVRWALLRARQDEDAEHRGAASVGSEAQANSAAAGVDEVYEATFDEVASHEVVSTDVAAFEIAPFELPDNRRRPRAARAESMPTTPTTDDEFDRVPEPQAKTQPAIDPAISRPARQGVGLHGRTRGSTGGDANVSPLPRTPSPTAGRSPGRRRVEGQRTRAGGAVPDPPLAETPSPDIVVGDRDEPVVTRRSTRQRDASGGPLDPPNLLERLQSYGVQPGAVAVPDDPAAAAPTQHAAPWVVPRLYALELARVLLLAGLAAVVLTAGWLASRAVADAELADGSIAAEALEHINQSRRALVTALGAAFSLVSLWAAVIVRKARIADYPNSDRWRGVVMVAASVLANVVAAVVDGHTRSGVSAICVAGCAGVALVGVLRVHPLIVWLGLGTRTLWAWFAGLNLVLVVSWVGGLLSVTVADHRVERLLFASVVVAVVAGMVLVVAAFSTTEPEDALKVAPPGGLRSPSAASRPPTD